MTIYTAFAYGIWILTILIWALSASDTKKNAKIEHLAEQILVSLLMLSSFVLLFVRNTSFSILQIPLIPQTHVLGVFGALLAAGGAAFAIWARLVLGRNWSGGAVTLKEGHELITAGPYVFVRHPIYAGFLSIALGTAITITRASAFIGFLCMLVAFLIRVRREEELMTQEFGEKYLTYSKTSKRLIPFVW